VAGTTKKFLLFKSLIAVGFGLGIILLIQTITTYKYVSGGLMMQEAERDSQRKVNTLVGAVRTAQTQDMEVIGGILQEFLADWSEQVAWIRILDGMGNPLASAGLAPVDPVPPERLQRAFASERRLPQRQDSAQGTVLVSIRSFRTVPLGPFSQGRSGRIGSANPEPGQRGAGGLGSRSFRPPIGLNWNVEIAIHPESVSGSFASLQWNLFVGVSVSLTLMAALVLIALRFPYYLRGQQIGRELNLARRVQADLLPSAETISPYVDFSAECISAWQVGGDFCDVFHVAEDRTALVLGDVSGKGISAALLMALVHGAIHSVAWTRSTQDHVSASRQLNTLLCQKTASERFTSIFWGYFDPQRSTIQYINAGHLPPLLIRKSGRGLEIHRLDTGGPVMGLLPAANFQQGEEFVASGDLLVAFSDGVVEATSPEGEEFGDNRLLSVIQNLWDASAADIRNAIHQRLRDFTGNAPVNDDQTLIVVRFKHSAASLSERRSSEASLA
jgi:serine phosphatase RsbU (regulator of sigma subunit)